MSSLPGFRESLDDILFKYGYTLNEHDDEFYHAPDDHDNERPLKFMEAIVDGLEVERYGRD